VVFVAPGSPDRWIRVPLAQQRRQSASGAAVSADLAAMAAGDGVVKDEPLDPKSLPEGEPDIEIEGLIIPAVKELHTKYIEDFRRK